MCSIEINAFDGNFVFYVVSKQDGKRFLFFGFFVLKLDAIRFILVRFK